MMRRALRVLAFCSGVAFAAPLPASSSPQEGSEDAPGQVERGDMPAPETPPAPPAAAGAPPGDPRPSADLDANALDALLRSLVDRYHEGTSQTPTESEVQRGLATVRRLLLDGVALDRIEAGVDRAIELHVPGRAVPFSIAVPLRIQPADSQTDNPSWSSQPIAREPAPLDPALEAERAERRARLAERRARYRLWRQWQERTREKRLLVGAGAPLFATGYALGFLSASVAHLQDPESQPSPWWSAVPVVGSAIWGAGSGQADRAGLGVLWTTTQLAGGAMAVVGLALNVDWPYERDPAALRGTDRVGRPWAVALRAGPGHLELQLAY